MYMILCRLGKAECRKLRYSIVEKTQFLYKITIILQVPFTLVETVSILSPSTPDEIMRNGLVNNWADQFPTMI